MITVACGDIFLFDYNVIHSGNKNRWHVVRACHDTCSISKFELCLSDISAAIKAMNGDYLSHKKASSQNEQSTPVHLAVPDLEEIAQTPEGKLSSL